MKFRTLVILTAKAIFDENPNMTWGESLKLSWDAYRIKKALKEGALVEVEYTGSKDNEVRNRVIEKVDYVSKGTGTPTPKTNIFHFCKTSNAKKSFKLINLRSYKIAA